MENSSRKKIFSTNRYPAFSKSRELPCGAASGGDFSLKMTLDISLMGTILMVTRTVGCFSHFLILLWGPQPHPLHGKDPERNSAPGRWKETSPSSFWIRFSSFLLILLNLIRKESTIYVQRVVIFVPPKFMN